MHISLTAPMSFCLTMPARSLCGTATPPQQRRFFLKNLTKLSTFFSPIPINAAKETGYRFVLLYDRGSSTPGLWLPFITVDDAFPDTCRVRHQQLHQYGDAFLSRPFHAEPEYLPAQKLLQGRGRRKPAKDHR